MNITELHAEWFRTIRAVEAAQIEYNQSVEVAKSELNAKMATLNAQIQRFIEQEQDLLKTE